MEIDSNEKVFAFLILKRKNWSCKNYHKESIIKTLTEKGVDEKKIDVTISKKTPESFPWHKIIIQFKLDSNCIPRMQI